MFNKILLYIDTDKKKLPRQRIPLSGERLGFVTA